MNEIIKLFDIPKEIIHDNERQRRVYSVLGIAPSVLARSDAAKILIIDDMYANRPIRIYSNYAPTLRSERSGLKVAKINSLYNKEE